MHLTARNLGKRYISRWVFRGLACDLPPGDILGVTGPNGSGKSTLLKILAGALPASEGTVNYEDRSGLAIAPSEVYQSVSFAAPYVDMIEEMTLGEAYRYHTRFRPFYRGLSEGDLLVALGSAFNRDLRIDAMSSGMKQRVRLVFAFMTRAGILFLDEPTSNLDVEGKAWFGSLVEDFGRRASLVIASNDADDLRYCERFLHLPDHSPGSI